MMTKGGKRSATTNPTIKNAEPISKKTTRSKSLSSTVSNKLSPKIRKRRVGNVFSVPISTSPSSPLASPATRRSGASTIGHGANTVCSPGPPSPTPLWRTKVHHYSPLKVAEELCLIDAELLRKIHPNELEGGAWMKDKKQELAPNVLAMVRASNELAMLVPSEILDETTPQGRAKVISIFIKVASKCYRLRNYNSLKAVLAGLQCTPIFRLHRSWKEVPAKRKKKFEALTKLMSEQYNWREYRADLKMTLDDGSPCIPFLGVLLTSIVQLDSVPRKLGRRYSGVEGYTIIEAITVRNRLERIRNRSANHRHSLFPTENISSSIDSNYCRGRFGTDKMTYVRGRSIDCGRFAGSNLSHAILDDDSESDASLADLASPPYNVESQPLDSPTQSDDWTFGMEDEYLNHREIREIKEEEPGFEGDTSQDNSTGAALQKTQTELERKLNISLEPFNQLTLEASTETVVPNDRSSDDESSLEFIPSVKRRDTLIQAVNDGDYLGLTDLIEENFPSKGMMNFDPVSVEDDSSKRDVEEADGEEATLNGRGSVIEVSPGPGLTEGRINGHLDGNGDDPSPPDTPAQLDMIERWASNVEVGALWDDISTPTTSPQDMLAIPNTLVQTVSDSMMNFPPEDIIPMSRSLDCLLEGGASSTADISFNIIRTTSDHNLASNTTSLSFISSDEGLGVSDMEDELDKDSSDTMSPDLLISPPSASASSLEVMNEQNHSNKNEQLESTETLRRSSKLIDKETPRRKFSKEEKVIMKTTTDAEENHKNETPTQNMGKLSTTSIPEVGPLRKRSRRRGSHLIALSQATSERGVKISTLLQRYQISSLGCSSGIEKHEDLQELIVSSSRNSEAQNYKLSYEREPQ